MKKFLHYAGWMTFNIIAVIAVIFLFAWVSENGGAPAVAFVVIVLATAFVCIPPYKDKS